MSDEMPPEIAALLEEERRAPGSPPGARDHMRARLAASLGPLAGLGGGGAGGGAPVAPAVAKVGLAKLGLAKIGLGMLALAVTGGGLFLATRTTVRRPTPSLPTPPPEPSAPTPSPPSPPPVAPVEVAPPSPPAPAAPPRPVLVPVKVKAPVSPKPSSPVAASEPPADGDLSRETTLLDEARTALARGDAALALLALGEHEHGFPNGILVEEREVLAIRALVLGEQGEAARARAAGFRARFPRSIQLPAVDAALEKIK